MISVVIPTKDRWRLASLAVETVLRQRDCELEVLIVDDGSRTDPPDHLTQRDDRARVLQLPESVGPAEARNVGLEAARGEWIAFLDDDDLWRSDHLSTSLQNVTDANAAWAYAGQVVVDGDGSPKYERPAPETATLTRELLVRNVIGTPSCVLARTDLVRQVGGFDPDFRVLADWDLWLRMLPHGHAARSPAFTVGYRVHGENMHLDVDLILSEWPELERRHGVTAEGLAAWVAGILRSQGDRRRAAAWYLRSARELGRPRDVLRAAGVLLGERAMRVGSRDRESSRIACEWQGVNGAG